MRRSSITAARLPDLRSALGHAAHWGLVDQALISSGNFVTTLALARTLSPFQFGEFLIGYTTVLLMNGLQLSLITQPMNVLGAKRLGADYRSYVRSMLLIQTIFSLASAALFVALTALAFLGGWQGAAILLACIPFMVCWQFQEFFRRVLYTEERLREAFVDDLAYYASQVGLLVLLWQSGRFSGETAFYAMAVSAGLSALMGWYWTKVGMQLRLRVEDFRASWDYGRWLVATNLAQWTTGYSYQYVIALLLGPVAPATLVAAGLGLRPLASFYLFLETILPIRFAKARAFGWETSRGQVRQVFWLTVIPVLAYCLLAGAFAREILALLYGDKYDEAVTIIRLSATFYVLLYINTLLTAILKEREDTRSIFVATVIAAIFTLPIGLILIFTLGMEGAVLALIVNCLLFGGAAWRFIIRPTAREANSASMAADVE